MAFNHIQPDKLIVRGENLPTQFNNHKKKFPKMKICQLPYEIGIKELSNEFKKLDGYYVIGIGNMVGWGMEFIQNLKKYRT